MIKGIGIDVIEIQRIKSAIKNLKGRFLNRIYTKSELKYCRDKDKLRIPELAVRFAAKEAYSKALGTGLRGIRWKEIEVVSGNHGKPYLKIRGKRSKKIHLSLSHSRNFAVATAVIEL